MNPPFTVTQFLDVFVSYNAAIWPVQMVVHGLGLAAVAGLWMGSRAGSRVVLVVLALMWGWNAIAYHLMAFAEINPVAPVFAAFFLAEALLLAGAVIGRDGVRFRIDGDLWSGVGLGIIGYTMLVYPVLGVWAGHGLMAGPMFGVAPCPTTIFTIGLLVLSRGRGTVWLSVIPLLWAAVGTMAAVQFGIVEDFGLSFSAIGLAAFLIRGLFARRGGPMAASARPGEPDH